MVGGLNNIVLRRIILLSFSIIFLSGFISFPASSKTSVKKTNNADEMMRKGREAFYNYDFETAADFYDDYRALKKKSKQPVGEEFEIWESELEVASNAFDRVRKIVIVDSISVPVEKFSSLYNLGSSAGRVAPANSLTPGADIDSREVGFINEGKDFIIYPKEDREGYLRLYEKTLLLDGKWNEKESLAGDFDKNGDYAYPFMSSDGQTLYFASNGEGSMGGYDLFVAQKDAITGEYLQPLNLGMPFNSPYDDIMLAIDEENGLGWWATDRNSEDGNLTVYVFLYDEIRKNYPADTENLIDLAMITSYKDTWRDDNNESFVPVMPSVNKTLHAGEETKKDFELPLGNGKTYYRFNDFKNRKAADMMKQYLAKNQELEKKEELLASLRKQYKSNTSVKGKIIQGEEEVEDMRAQIKAMKSEVLRLEKSVK